MIHGSDEDGKMNKIFFYNFRYEIPNKWEFEESCFFGIIVRVISFAKLWVRQRILGSKNSNSSDETKHSRSKGMAKWCVQVMNVRWGDKLFITIFKKWKKVQFFHLESLQKRIKGQISDLFCVQREN